MRLHSKFWLDLLLSLGSAWGICSWAHSYGCWHCSPQCGLTAWQLASHADTVQEKWESTPKAEDRVFITSSQKWHPIASSVFFSLEGSHKIQPALKGRKHTHWWMSCQSHQARLTWNVESRSLCHCQTASPGPKFLTEHGVAGSSMQAWGGGPQLLVTLHSLFLSDLGSSVSPSMPAILYQGLTLGPMSSG